MFLSVIIATHNRYEAMVCLYENLKKQHVKPDEIIIVDSSDIAGGGYDWFKDDWILKERHIEGACLTRQRNLGIDALDERSDIAAFIDDDVLLENDFFKIISDIYKEDNNAEISGLGGFVTGEDEDFKYFYQKPVLIKNNEVYKTKTLYGCNMIYRRKVVMNERFDENLLFYGFQEDRDFSLRANKYGLVVRTKHARLRHLRVKSGRIDRLKLGFSLLGNPYYIMKKHGDSVLRIQYHLLHSFTIIMLKAIFKKEHRACLMGAFIALKQILSGKFCPQNIKFL